jgi:hypothetical protein
MCLVLGRHTLAPQISKKRTVFLIKNQNTNLLKTFRKYFFHTLK